jgi:hypothetical protein
MARRKCQKDTRGLDRDGERFEPHEYYKSQKRDIVLFSNASAHPCTMVITIFDATFACVAMVRGIRPGFVALVAEAVACRYLVMSNLAGKHVKEHGRKERVPQKPRTGPRVIGTNGGVADNGEEKSSTMFHNFFLGLFCWFVWSACSLENLS